MLKLQIFLQTIEITNSYWFTSWPTTYITILLTTNHSSQQQFVKKFVDLVFSSF